MKDVPSLADKLLGQLGKESGTLKLSENSPVLEFLPPFLLKEITSSSPQDANFHYQFHSKPEEKPGRTLVKGHPKEIHRFLVGLEDVYLDFEQLGCVLISRDLSLPGIPNEKMSQWLNYALSPELWGPDGKWNRFHERLHNLFEKQNLLEGHSVPGYYPLKSQGRNWEKLSIEGDHKPGCFALVLPWTFSLTDLKKLESLINEEP